MGKLIKLLYGLFGVLLLINLSACEDSSDSEVEELKKTVAELEETIAELRNASSNGKVIQSINPLTGTDKGWLITFSDNTSIEVLDGNNAESVIASVKKDEEENKVTLVMSDGTTFIFNLDPAGANGIVLLRNRLKMVPNSTSVLEFRVNPSNAVFNYDIESADCQIEIDMVGDATRALAPSYVTAPTNYKLIKVEPALNEAGETKEGQYKAHIRDEGLSDSYSELISLVISTKNTDGKLIQTSSAAIEIYAGAGSGAVGVVFDTYDFKTANNTKADGFEVILNVANTVTIENDLVTVALPYYTDITDLAAVFTLEPGCEVFVGETPQVSGVTKNDFTYPVRYRIISPDKVEETIKVEVKRMGLPVVYIDTPGQAEITSKTEWTENSEMKIVLEDGSIDYQGTTSIRGRGNSTWTNPKKPYALKLDNKASILEMPSHKRWVLLANWMDRTLLRNHVAFEISKKTELDWTSRGKFVEVVLNGKHVGNYYLCEQIKVDKNRVNIKELKYETTDPTEITGGYLLEFDTNFDEKNKFYSAHFGMPVMLKDPDEDALNDFQFAYIQDFINNTIEGEFQKANYTGTRNYTNNLDVNSFIDWWIVHELTSNAEPGHPKSVYMHKDREGKLKAGPVWDFDWQTFSDHPHHKDGHVFVVKNAVWYSKLFADPIFVNTVKTRWNLFKPQFDAIPTFIQDEAKYIKNSSNINIQLWPLYDRPNINYDEQKTFDEAIQLMVNQYKKRLTWLHAEINKM